MIRVLFVCLGNICRSPMAEGIFNDIIRKKGLSDKIEADSAGTANYHIGESPDPRTLQQLAKNNIQLVHKGRQLVSSDAKRFDYIFVMDSANYRDAQHILGSGFDNLYLIRTFDPDGRDEDVPDPYYGGKDGFEKVYTMLERSMNEIVSKICLEKNLTHE